MIHLEINEFGYFAKTVADQLGTKSNTLGTWARELERCGIKFEKNEKGQRIYSDKDVRAFAKMKELLDLGHELAKVGKFVSEEFEKGTYDEVLEVNHAQITPSVIDENHAQIPLQSRMDEFKTEIISSVLDGLKDEFAVLSQQMHQLQQTPKVEMIPPPDHSETLEQILDSVQTLQKRPPEVPSASYEEKYQRLLDEHNRVIGNHNKTIDTVNKLLAEKEQMKKEHAEKESELQSEVKRLRNELEKWRSKPFWKSKP